MCSPHALSLLLIIATIAIIKSIQEHLQAQILAINGSARLTSNQIIQFSLQFLFVVPDIVFVHDEVGWIVHNYEKVVNWDDHESKIAKGTYRH